MEVSDVHVGKQLQCNFSIQGTTPNPPLCYGSGPTAVPGTGFFNGGILVGSPLSFPIPNVPEAALMVGRPEPISNPLAAKALSIFKVTSRASTLPLGSPIDVMLGDPTGPVGVTCFCGVQPFTVQAALIDLITVKYLETAVNKVKVGATEDIGAKTFAGAKVELGVDSNLALAFNAAPINGDAPVKFPDVTYAGGTVVALDKEVKTKKSFDIPHPNKPGYRLRHACVEGPEAAIYIRGRLKDNHIIELPDYWNGLIDPETITVNLTQIGSSQDLIVEKIEWGKKIIVRSGNGTSIDCYYHIWADRLGEKLIVEYEGETPADYPGSNDKYSVAGWDYDVHSK